MQQRTVPSYQLYGNQAQIEMNVHLGCSCLSTYILVRYETDVSGHYF